MTQTQILICIFSATLGLTGCTRHHHPHADTLVVAISSQPATLDPRFATDATGMRVDDLIFNSLVHLGPDLKPKPEAAERWTYANRVFTFYLRRDLHFQNGRPVTPDDIQFTFDQFLGPQSPYTSDFAIIKNVKSDVENGQLVVRIAVKNYSDKFLVSDLPSIKILPKKETLAAGPDFYKVLLGTGGYRFVKQSLNEIELEAVHARTPHLIFRVIHDDFTRYQKMMKGEIDIAQDELPPTKVAAFNKHPERFEVFRYPGLNMSYILVNFLDPVLRQKAVRLALSESIHRQEIIRYKLMNLASEATSLLTPPNPYFDSDLKNAPFNLADAKKIIRQLHLVGKKIILKTSNSADAIDYGKVLANEMSQTGLDVELESYEWGTFYQDVKEGSFQLATLRWVGVIDPDLYRAAFDSKEYPPGRNRGRYNNPALDKLLEAGEAEENSAKRRKIYLKVQKIVHDDLAIIPLWYNEQVAIARNVVKDYHPNITGDYRSLLTAYKTR